MIIIGLGQIVAGTLLVLSSLPLWQVESYFLSVADAVVGAYVIYHSIQHQTPTGV